MQLKVLLAVTLATLAVAAPSANRDRGGHRGNSNTQTSSCSQKSTTMCCTDSGKKCEAKDSCDNNQQQICGNVLYLGGLRLARRTNGGWGDHHDDGGDNGDSQSVSCSQSSKTYCCDDSGKNCKAENSCNSNQFMFCPNIDIDLLGGGSS